MKIYEDVEAERDRIQACLNKFGRTSDHNLDWFICSDMDHEEGVRSFAEFPDGSGLLASRYKEEWRIWSDPLTPKEKKAERIGEFSKKILGGEINVPTIDGELKLKIRPGTQPGTMVRLAGRGIKHLHSSSRGDEYVHLIVKLPEKLSREQKELLEKFSKTQNSKKGWF